MKFLHLILDEKFPDSAYEFFEAVAPGQNIFMLHGKSAPIRHLKKIRPVRVSKYAFWSPKFVRSLEQYDAIILHSLYAFSLEVLARLSDKVPVVWIGMGYDYYDLLTTNPSDLLKPDTLALQSPVTLRLTKTPKQLIKGLVRRAIYPSTKHKRKLVQKIDLFAPVLQSEYQLVKEVIGNKPFPRYVRWNYGRIADLVDGKLGSKKITGSDILVGNSAHPANNHLDAFHMLAKAGIPGDSNIVAPLSYGDLDYRDKVIAEGERLFGRQFKPITEFMSMDEYIDLMCSCSSVVMNHLRQQAAGNLGIALYLGARVYLDTANPLYEEFKSMGFSVKSLSELRSDKEELNKPLEDDLVGSHTKILRATRGRAAFEQYTNNLIAEVKQICGEKAS